MVRHGVRVPTAGKPQDTGRFAAELEASGFDFMWVPDTPVLAGRWRDVYVHLTCAALQTSQLRLGPGVTNPLTRHPVTTASAIVSINDASHGRAELLAGTGYSSAYIIGQRAATRASMERATRLWRSIFSAAPTDLGGLEIELAPGPAPIPIYLAATGERMLQLAGEIADGVLIMVGAAPGAVQWALEQVEAGMQRAGRTREQVQRLLVVTACVDRDRRRAIEWMRPCAGSLYRHQAVEVLLARAGISAPASIPSYPQPYPDLHHAVDWEEACRLCSWVPDDAVEAMVALGPPEEVAERAEALMALDIDAIWWRDEQSYARPEALARALAEDVLPRLA